MASKKDTPTEKIERAIKMVERARKAITSVTKKSPDWLVASNERLSDEAAKALFDKAEEQFAKAEYARATSERMVEEINAAIEDSLTRERRREMAIDKLLASEDSHLAATPTKSARKPPPLTARILRDMPKCGATWDMRLKMIATKLDRHWKNEGNPYSGLPDSLERAVKDAKRYANGDAS
jgi:hypothetical protein